jgi:hypothetical protein
MRKNIVWSLYLIIFLLFTLSTHAVIPKMYINETGNITSTGNVLTGEFSPEQGFRYSTFRTILGNFSYYNQTIERDEIVYFRYDRTFNETPFNENITITKALDIITAQYNVTNNFDGYADIEMLVTVPSFCTYHNYTANATIANLDIVGNELNFTYKLYNHTSLLLNVTCQGISGGSETFQSASYVIRPTHPAPYYHFNILPKSYFSVFKDPLVSGTSPSNGSEIAQDWRAAFEYTNADEISVDIKEVLLWAVPITNVTKDPLNNSIYNETFTSCLNDADGLLHTDETCHHEGFFQSPVVPVIWSEVKYETAWEYVGDLVYYFNGIDENFDFEAFNVTLENPENNSYHDLNISLNLEYSVTKDASVCRLYTNRSGTWMRENVTKNGTARAGNFTIITPNEITSFIWNVLCYADDGSDALFANNNYTININNLHYLSQNISDITWPEDTNYTLNMSQYFTDVENDDLNFSHQPNPVVNITFFANNSTDIITIVPDPDFFGERTARIVAIDEFGRSVYSNVFLMNVTNEPDAPRIVFWNVTNGTWWTSNETDLTTPEGSTLNFTADAFDPDEDSVFLNFYWFIDNILSGVGKLFSWYVDFFQQGERNVTLKVNDSTGLFDVQTWIVNVTNVNVPPTSQTIPDIYWKQNTTYYLNLSKWFSDIDAYDSVLNYTFWGNLQNITVLVNQTTSIMSFTPDVNWLGVNERWIIINATDTMNFTNTSNNISLTVYPYILRTLPDVVFDEDMWNDTINLTQAYNTNNYTWVNLSWGFYGINLSFSLFGSGPLQGILNITSSPDWFGNQTVLAHVNHSVLGWNDTVEFDVSVLPINDPPVLDDASYSIVENATPANNWIDLWSHSYDIDNIYPELNYSVVSQTNPGLLTCSVVSNRYLNCTAPPLWSWGVNYVNVTVSDGEYSDAGLFTIRVLHDNQAPVIRNWNLTFGTTFIQQSDGIYDVEVYEGTTLEFAIDAWDLEFDPLYHYWFMDDVSIGNQSTQNITFGYHDVGTYVVKYFLNQSDGQGENRTWIINIINKNRPPDKVNLSLPLNNSFHSVLFEFNWSNTTDPDAFNATIDDYYEFVYILQVDDDPTFVEPVLDVQLANATTYVLDTIFPDGRYYWRVLAFDGADSSSSEIWTFFLDLNPPELYLDINPNPVEFQLRDSNVTWRVDEMFLSDAYINITFPNGSFLGEYSGNVTLTPWNLTQLGNYVVRLFARDVSNNTAQTSKILSVINDTVAPIVTLIDPEDVSISGSSTIIFSYDYEDIGRVDNCTLYLQERNIIYDVVGGIMYSEPSGPWQRVMTDFQIEDDNNYFVYGALDDDSYQWGVECTDISGNTGYSENRTFRVLTNYTAPIIPVYPFDDEPVGEVIRQDGYNLEISIDPVYGVVSENVEGTLRLKNTGERTIYDITLNPSVPWVYFDEQIDFLQPGESLNVSFTINAPLTSGDYIYHISVNSDTVKKFASGYLYLNALDGVPLRVVKRVYAEEEYYNISLQIINYLATDIKVYIEDSIKDMKQVVFSDDDFYSAGDDYLAVKQNTLRGNEMLFISFTAMDINITTLEKPTVISDLFYEVDLEIVSPHYFNMLVFRKTSIELILIIILILVVLGFGSYIVYYEAANKYL